MSCESVNQIYQKSQSGCQRGHVPDTYSQQCGERQHGGIVDIVQPVVRRRMLGFDRAVLNLALRLEYVDWNNGSFVETGGNIADDAWGVVAGD